MKISARLMLIAGTALAGVACVVAAALNSPGYVLTANLRATVAQFQFSQMVPGSRT